MPFLAGASVPVLLSDSSLVASVLLGPLLQQPFVFGPGFSPILVKKVSHIVASKYVDLGDLLTVNIVQTEPESQAFLDRRLVFLPSALKRHCCLGHRDLVRIFFLYIDSDVLFSTLLERLNILQAPHLMHVQSVQWLCLACM